MEKFVARVLKGGKVTIPKRLRELLKIEEGVYARAFILCAHNSDMDFRKKGVAGYRVKTCIKHGLSKC